MTFSVLQLIPILGQRACGSEICDLLSQRLGEDVPAAKIYVLLKRLENDGLVTSDSESSELAALRGSRRRRIYRLTEEGTLAVEAGMKLYDGNQKDLPEWRPTAIARPNGPRS